MLDRKKSSEWPQGIDHSQSQLITRRTLSSQDTKEQEGAEYQESSKQPEGIEHPGGLNVNCQLSSMLHCPGNHQAAKGTLIDLQVTRQQRGHQLVRKAPKSNERGKGLSRAK